MLKNKVDVKRKKPLQANLAYLRYRQEALLRFDLEGTAETIRQQLERISAWDAMGDYAMSDSIRTVVEQERAHQIDLAAALGKAAPDARNGVDRSRARIGKLSSEA